MPTTKHDLAIIRRAYAKQIDDAVGVTEKRIEDAFAEVPREDYLGPGPWPIYRHHYAPTQTSDPVYLYTDNLVGIISEQRINNGQPFLHALLLSHANLREGEDVVHVGAGVGYYTAIMAQMVGASGKVTAIEFNKQLARRSRQNLSSCANVTVLTGDGSAAPFDPADVIYVNARATRPADIWSDRFEDAGV